MMYASELTKFDTFVQGLRANRHEKNALEGIVRSVTAMVTPPFRLTQQRT